MFEVLPPIDPLTQAPRRSSFRCSPLSRRRTLPSPRHQSFNQPWRQNSIELAGIRKFASRPSSVPRLPSFPPLVTPPADSARFALVPSIAPGISILAKSGQCKEIPDTPVTPIECQDYYPSCGSQCQPHSERKADIFGITTKSDELIVLVIAALRRIYTDRDSLDDSAEVHVRALPSTAPQVSGWLSSHPSVEDYEQSPPPLSASSASSTGSMASDLWTPRSLSPISGLETASVCRTIHNNGIAPTIPAASAKPVIRTRSAPAMPTHAPPALGDEEKLRWFIVELLRRSRSSASVVQLALHYLTQVRDSITVPHPRMSTRDGGDSLLLDPRRLVLAALMLSTKLLHDHAPNGRAWGRVCGLSPPEVSACERMLCQALGWRLANMFVGPCPRDNQPII